MILIGKLVIYRDRQLICNSSIIEDYPMLIEFFKNTPDMDERELHMLSKDIQLFFKNIFSKVKVDATSEWDIDYSHPIDILDDKNKIRCELCNHKIKNVCYIINKITGRKLRVGTECVKYFGMDRNISIEKLLEERLKTKRLETLNKNFPGIQSKISKWNLFIDMQPIFIKNQVKNKYIQLGEKALELFNNFCEKNLNKEKRKLIIENLRSIFMEQQHELESINRYVFENKDNKFIPKKEIVQLLKRNNEVQTLKWLEEDGIIKGRTMFRITAEQFVKSLIPDFNYYLKRIKCSIENSELRKGKMGYIINYNKNNSIKLFIPYSEFCIQYGGLITNESIDTALTFEEILKMGSIYGEESIENVIGIFELALDKYNIVFDYIYYEFDDVIVYEKRTKRYFLTNLSNLLEKFKFLAFKLGNTNKKELYDFIMSQASMKYNEGDIKDLKKKRDRSA